MQLLIFHHIIFYAKLAGGLEPQQPVSGTTLLLEDEGSEDIAQAVIKASQVNYATKYVADTTVKTERKGKAKEGNESQRPEDDA